MRISERDRERWAQLSLREDQLRHQGYRFIAGVDEAGRGPLAGPVVAAAVVLGDAPLYGLNDSKKMTAARREALYEQIMDTCDVAIAQVGPHDIDVINILQATLQAMRMAVLSLANVDYCLVDAATIPRLEVPQSAVVHGDANVNAIAAASVIAKVTRDRLMMLYDDDYPVYGFAAHKGYGTAQHMAVLRKIGPCAIHRRSFLTKLS